MQNLASVNQHSEKEPWFGQMTIPRELAIKKGRLIQRPVRELDACRHNMVSYTNAIISGEKTLKGVCGRIADIELSIAPQSEENRYYMFEMRLRRMTNIIRHFVTIRMSLSLSLTEAILVQELQWYISVHARCKTTVDHSSFEL